MTPSAAPTEQGWRGARRLLRGPLRTLVAGQALGQFGDGLAQIAFAQLVVFDIGKGATPGRVAGVLAVTLLPFTLVGPFAGVLIDRWDRRRTLVVTSWVRALIAVAAVVVAVEKSEALAYAGVLLLLSTSRFVLAAKGAVLPRTVAPYQLVTANAMSSVIGMVAAFVGAIGGAAFVSASAAAGFVVAAVGYATAGWVFLRLPPMGGGVVTPLASRLRRTARELAEGAAAIAGRPDIRRPLLAVWAHRLLLGAGLILLVLVADRRYHLEASGYALALAITGVAAFAGSVAAPVLAKRWRPTALLALAFLPPAVAAVVSGYAPALPGLLVALAIAAVSFQVLKVLTDALVGRATDDSVRGRVFAAYDVLYNLAFVLAGLAMVPLWHPGHERALLWLVGGGFAAGWLVVARVQRAWPFTAVGAARVPVPHRWRWRGATLLVGALPALAFPQAGLWWLAWVGLVPWLLLVRSAPSAREAAWRGWYGALGFLLAVHHWLVPNTGVFLLLAAVVLGLLWLPWSLTVWWLLGTAAPFGRRLAGVLVVPAAWVLAEAVRSWSSLGGPWGLLGASQWNVDRLLAPAALGGVWLVSFLVVAANTAVTVAVVSRGASRRLAAGLVAAAVVGIGPASYAVEPSPAGVGTTRLAIVQPGVVHNPRARLDAELASTAALPAGQFDLVVWGESSVGIDLEARPDVLARLVAASSRVGAPLLVNVDAHDRSGAIHKTAVLVGPGGVLATYEKMRLVPFGEYIPFRRLLDWVTFLTKAAKQNRGRGHSLVVMRIAGTDRFSFAPLVCFESAFPDLSRRAALMGAGVIVVQSATSSFQGSWAPAQHASLAAVRAVETGRPVVHATLTGTTAVFDARGGRLAWFDTHHRGVVRLAVPLATRHTPYLRWGDWVLAWSFIVLGVAATVASLRAARL